MVTGSHPVAADADPVAAWKPLPPCSEGNAGGRPSDGQRTTTGTQTLRRQRNRLLVAAVLFAYLALLVVWKVETVRAGPLEPWGVLTLGAILGAMTGVGFVVHHYLRFYLRSRR
jgi:hypothetical protein